MDHKSYKDLQKWKEVMRLLPKHNQIDEDSMPEESYWEWENNQIHIDYYRNSEAKSKLIILHGVGGNGRLLSFIGVPLFKQGIEVIAPDLPGYGVSIINSKSINFSMWVKLVNDLIEYELKKDSRPIFLFGLSAGGMLAYHAASKNQKVAGVIFTNLLDQRIQEVRDYSAIHPLVSRVGIKILKLFSNIIPRLKVPMKFVANSKAIVNDKEVLEILISDKTSTGASVPIEFILSLIEATPDIEPEQFKVCPALLVHPGEDHWTPVRLSQLFFDRLVCSKKLVMLENAGHFPIEYPGVIQLENEVLDFIDD